MQSTHEGREVHRALCEGGVQVHHVIRINRQWRNRRLSYQAGSNDNFFLSLGTVTYLAQMVAEGVHGAHGDKHIYNPQLHVTYSRRHEDGSRTKSYTLNFYA
jgi:hypothetical protein